MSMNKQPEEYCTTDSREFIFVSICLFTKNLNSKLMSTSSIAKTRQLNNSNRTTMHPVVVDCYTYV